MVSRDEIYVKVCLVIALPDRGPYTILYRERNVGWTFGKERSVAALPVFSGGNASFTRTNI